MKEKMKRTVVALLCILMVVTFMPITTATAASKMKVEWFNVGAGDSMFIKFPNGQTVLIDGGTVTKGYTVVNKLRKMHVNTINYCISTHPDSDHCGGLKPVFEQLQVKNFYYPGDADYSATETASEVISLARSEGCAMHNPATDTRIHGGNGATLTFVESSEDYDTDNKDSLASFINYGDLQILTCGDCEDGAEDAIEQHNCDIVQLPHHGSKYSTDMTFLQRFDPEMVVVSTDGHKYGHPNREVFSRCKRYDSKIKVWRTDKVGDIVVTATGKSWNFARSGVLASKYINAAPSSKNTGNSSSKVTAGYVYITRTGTRYHSRKNCRGLSNARKIYKVPISEARAKGLTKCKLCW